MSLSNLHCLIQISRKISPPSLLARVGCKTAICVAKPRPKSLVRAENDAINPMPADSMRHFTKSRRYFHAKALYWMMPRYSSVYWLMPRYSSVYWLMPRYSSVYWLMSRYSSAYWLMPRYSIVYWPITCNSSVYWLIIRNSCAFCPISTNELKQFVSSSQPITCLQ